MGSVLVKVTVQPDASRLVKPYSCSRSLLIFSWLFDNFLLDPVTLHVFFLIYTKETKMEN